MGTVLILHIQRQWLREANNLPKVTQPLCGLAGVCLRVSQSLCFHALNHHGSWPSPFTPSIHKVHRERGTENDFQVNKVITVILRVESHIKYCESTTEGWINIYLKAILLLQIRNTSAYPWDGYCFSVVVIGAWFLLCFAFWKGKETPWVGWSYLKGIWRQPNSMQSMPPWGHLRVLTAT